MQLSKNFHLSEFTKSNTAERLGLENIPNELHIRNLKDLSSNVLQPLRDDLGSIYISSGYRGKDLNDAIGGAYKSQHCMGQAADIDMDNRNGASNRQVFEYIKNNLEFDKLIWEFGDYFNPSWVHVSFNKGSNRKKIIKVFKTKSGLTQYKDFE